ncbi:hypothetical protein [Clostridium perfringens]|uniref:hypothetical protein n=1 Tax=Clostridium perfringens TaxID=1502 RepID=UPI00096A2455|nr:hypothetical protein [Clostridium perfringens]
MAKIENDKYYTPKELAKYCVKKTKEIIGEDNIAEWLEPSAGCGNFLDYLGDNYLAYDILPEDDRIVKQDYLELNLKYKKERCIIGNPPYGRCLNLAQKFYKKSIELGDYVAFILPISQLDNNRSFYEFDLIHSEDLGKRNYSGINLHCCFNIYRRNPKGLNKPKKSKLKDITIIRQDSKNYKNKEFDIRMCYWGNGSAGKILKDINETYSGEYKIQIHNNKLRNEIIKVLEEVIWKERLNKIAMIRIKQYDIINLLKEQIPEIQ